MLYQDFGDTTDFLERQVAAAQESGPVGAGLSLNAFKHLETFMQSALENLQAPELLSRRRSPY